MEEPRVVGLAGIPRSHLDDIGGWFDLLNVDDYVTFGGKA
jgi:hypothetical protein